MLVALSVVVMACGPSGSSVTPATEEPIASSDPAPAPTAAPTAAPASSSIRPPIRAAGSGGRSRFVSLDNPEFVTAAQASYLSDDELVLGLYAEGEARAYPVRMIYYHHIVNDVVRGRPILVTY